MKALGALALLFVCLAGTASAAGAKTIPAGVRVAGVKVGGLTTAGATRAVQQAFDKPVSVVVDKRSFALRPAGLATAYVAGAIGHAASAAPGTRVPLVVSVHGAGVRTVVDRLSSKVKHHAANGDLALTLRDGKPYVAPSAFGRTLDVQNVIRHVVHELSTNSRLPLHFSTKSVEPRALASASNRVIVISRAKNVLSLYNGTKLFKQFSVATGQPAYPTPAGRFHIIVMWKNPTWYPPTYDAWAKGLKPVPPGPDNPLGTRWMGLSVPGVGIHGTDEPTSIGYSESHGCIRMQVPQAEWLFNHVTVGTTVFIT